MKHISETALEEYHLGKIPEGRRLAKLEEHLLACPRCADRAEKAAQYVDTMRAAIVSGNFDWDSLGTAKRTTGR
jgi:anti-sigma factor RsiW